MGNYHVPFWRAVGEATPSLTLIILKKVETQLGLCLVKVCRQVLTLATRFRIWETKTKKRKEVALARTVATV